VFDAIADAWGMSVQLVCWSMRWSMLTDHEISTCTSISFDKICRLRRPLLADDLWRNAFRAEFPTFVVE
jgi:hypothetical protein